MEGASSEGRINTKKYGTTNLLRIWYCSQLLLSWLTGKYTIILIIGKFKIVSVDIQIMEEEKKTSKRVNVSQAF